MRKLLIISSILIILFFIEIPPYVELNDLAIIETIGIEYKDNQYTVFLKEVIPTKGDQGIDYKYKYYDARCSNIIDALNKIKKETPKKIYLSKVQKLVTNIRQTNNIKKELDIKPNSIIHTNNIKENIKD